MIKSHPTTLLTQRTFSNSEPSTVGPEVSESLLESDSVLPSSESEYFPTPEKRQRVAMQQPVEGASLGRGMLICMSLFTGISIFRSSQC